MPYLLKLFNGVLFTEKVPNSWGSGIIIPIYKSWDRSDPSNYCGITLSGNVCSIR